MTNRQLANDMRNNAVISRNMIEQDTKGTLYLGEILVKQNKQMQEYADGLSKRHKLNIFLTVFSGAVAVLGAVAGAPFTIAGGLLATAFNLPNLISTHKKHKVVKKCLKQGKELETQYIAIKDIISETLALLDKRIDAYSQILGDKSLTDAQVGEKVNQIIGTGKEDAEICEKIQRMFPAVVESNWAWEEMPRNT